jgi:phenylacetyl-CoA:acceptor oxidoreductase 27-kDa subunit
MRWGMAIDLRKCVGCQTCTIACHEENALPPSLFWRQVLDVEVGEYPAVTRTFVPTGCMHCAKPPCVPVCPTGASQQRADGIVFVDYAKCIGCGYCAIACPYHARHMVHQHEWYFGEPTPSDLKARDPDRHGVMTKCTFCRHRVDRAPEGARPGVDPEYTPVCVNSCIANAMHFGDLDDPESNVSRLAREHDAERLLEELELQPSLYYITKRPPESRSAPKSPVTPAQLQEEWDLYHATWFTLMGVGGGLFLLSRLLGLDHQLGLVLGLPVVDLLSFLVIGVGGLVLLWSLGRPLRFLRAVVRFQTSWISRGAIADFVFLVTGAALLLPDFRVGASAPFASLPWNGAGSGPIGATLVAVALASSAVVIVYAGLVMADKAAIPFWRSAAIPIQFLLSSLAMSMAGVMLLETVSGVTIGARECWLLSAFLAFLLLAVGWHLGTRRSAPGKSESLERLYAKFGWAFLGGVVAAGTVLPMLLGVAGALSVGARDAAGIVALLATVAGGFALRLIILRVGFFAPVTGAVRGTGR